MKCREFVEFLMEYLDGALAEQERSVFEGHIEDCPACVNYLATYRETVRLGNRVCTPDAELPRSERRQGGRCAVVARINGADYLATTA